MEKNIQTNLPLLLRMSPSLETETDPPKLSSRMTTLPLRKREQKLSNELNKRWRSSERESTPVSKLHHVLPTNWKSGLEYQTRRTEKHSTPTLPKSTPSLLYRMRTTPLQEKHLFLLKHLSQPISNQPESRSGMKLKTSWTKFPKESLKRKNLSNKQTIQKGAREEDMPWFNSVLSTT